MVLPALSDATHQGGHQALILGIFLVLVLMLVSTDPQIPVPGGEYSSFMSFLS